MLKKTRFKMAKSNKKNQPLGFCSAQEKLGIQAAWGLPCEDLQEAGLVASAIKTPTLVKQTQEETTNFSIILLTGKSLELWRAHCNTTPAPGLGRCIGRIKITSEKGVDTGKIVPLFLSTIALLGMSCNSWIIWIKWASIVPSATCVNC